MFNTLKPKTDRGKAGGGPAVKTALFRGERETASLYVRSQTSSASPSTESRIETTYVRHEAHLNNT
jgi:hypothetical protein